MSPDTPLKTIEGACPNCGPSRIDVSSEGSSYFIGLTTPNWYCIDWFGRCCRCHTYLETSLERDDEAGSLEWTLVDEAIVEFRLGGPSST